MRLKHGLLFIVAAVALSGCEAPPDSITSCENTDRIDAVCEFQRPEDFAALPDGRHIVVSEFGGMYGEMAGRLSLLDSEEWRRRELTIIESGPQRWGSADCQSPLGNKLSPHGIHLSQRSDGKHQLLVVNHGQRESVEMYELRMQPFPTLIWRGCVIAPETALLNDVVGLADGGFIVTSMYDRTAMKVGHLGLPMFTSPMGFKVGHAYEWNGEALQLLEYTRSPVPNGIEISHDGSTLFLNVSRTNEVWKIDRATGETLGVAEVVAPDNSSWAADGRLLVASLTEGLRGILACFNSPREPCGARYEIVAIDPETMTTETLFEHRGAPMGAATVALQHKDRWVVGSFVGDRLVTVKMSP